MVQAAGRGPTWTPTPVLEDAAAQLQARLARENPHQEALPAEQLSTTAEQKVGQALGYFFCLFFEQHLIAKSKKRVVGLFFFFSKRLEGNI